MGWFFGFKLHVAINHVGEITAFCLTPGKTDDRKPVPKLSRNLQDWLLATRGISRKTDSRTGANRHQIHYQNTQKHEAG